MTTLHPVVSALLQAVKDPRCVLFAGSGVSARVGLPTWGTLLLKLADACDEHGDALSAQHIRAKTKDGDLLAAATIYRLCDKMPEGVKQKAIQQALGISAPGEDELQKLDSLLGLKFSAIVTTNYDRVLHSAYSRVYKDSAIQLEKGDDSLKNGALRREFFVARVHGKIEQPETLVLDTLDYKLLDGDDVYKEFLVSLLTSRPCVFIGFSFQDPAIEKILKIYSDRAGPNFPEMHLAIIPDTQQALLGKDLGKVGIKTVNYSAGSDHTELWRLIRTTWELVLIAPHSIATKPLKTPERYSTFKRFIAFGYTQMKARGAGAPLIEVSQEGIVLSLVETAGENGISELVIAQKLAGALKCSPDVAQRITYQVLARLFVEKSVVRKENNICITKSAPSEISAQLSILANAIITRMNVICGIKTELVSAEGIRTCLENLFLVRAWDLAAFYAGSAIGFPPDLAGAIDEVVTLAQSTHKLGSPAAAKTAIAELLERPTDREGIILGEIGRTAFALQVLLASPQTSSFQRHSLPEFLYLDSNVLLPAIVDGHPFHDLYTSVISRLLAAAKENKANCNICVGYSFLNEVVSHKYGALEAFIELKLDLDRNLEKHLTFHGAHHGNVFISAYATHLKRAGKFIGFREFLNKAAPYNNEAQLKSYLEGRGYIVRSFDPKRYSTFSKFKSLIISGYRGRYLSFDEEKEPILIDHEAVQLCVLADDLQKNVRSVFVTADLRLTNVIYSDETLRRLSGTILSNWGLVGLVDLLLGVKMNAASFARLAWTSPRDEEQQRIRDYFVQRALQSYDSALIAKMPEVIEEIVRDAEKERQQRHLNMSESHDIKKLVKINEFLDRYEEKFFELMKSAIEKDKREARDS